MLGNSNAYAMLPVKDMDVAKKFYGKTLELEEGDSDEGGTSYKTGSTHVYVYPSKYAGTNKGTAASWTVDDVDAVAKWLGEKDVKFEHYDFPGTKREGDVHVMGEMRAAWFKDPSGNILGINN